MHGKQEAKISAPIPKQPELPAVPVALEKAGRSQLQGLLSFEELCKRDRSEWASCKLFK